MNDKNQVQRVAAQYLSKKAGRYYVVHNESFDLETEFASKVPGFDKGSLVLKSPIQGYGHTNDGMIALEYAGTTNGQADDGEIRLAMDRHKNKIVVSLVINPN